MLYTGIDIVKRTHTALALQDDRRPLWSDFEFTNDRDGFESLLVQAVAPDDQVLVGADYMRIGNQQLARQFAPTRSGVSKNRSLGFLTVFFPSMRRFF